MFPKVGLISKRTDTSNVRVKWQLKRLFVSFSIRILKSKWSSPFYTFLMVVYICWNIEQMIPIQFDRNGSLFLITFTFGFFLTFTFWYPPCKKVSKKYQKSIKTGGGIKKWRLSFSGVSKSEGYLFRLWEIRKIQLEANQNCWIITYNMI